MPGVGDLRPDRRAAERWLEAGLFSSRWLMAPFYVGLVMALAALLAVFIGELITELSGITELRPEGAILMALSLIDLSLAGNLILIVIFSGYENFVSKIDADGHAERSAWMGTVDFSGLSGDWSARSWQFLRFPCCEPSCGLGMVRWMRRW
jgi:uncharacterized protein (TIGR00645 family)